MAAPKVLEILQLFTVDAPRWRVDRIAAHMGVSTSTAYRCVAELVKAGFLQPVSGGAYVLGPAFIEFDLRMRLSDPLLRAALPQMRQLHTALGPQTTTMLARYYRDCVMFVHIDRSRDAPAGQGQGRGQQISLFSPAAMARAVLFALPDRALRTLYQRHAAEIARAGLGATPRDFRAHIKALRERGWTSARSVVVSGRVGIGAPVTCNGNVRGSIGISLPEPMSDREIERAAQVVVGHAGLVAAQLGKDGADVPRLLGRRPAARVPGPLEIGASLQ
jgi:DNA-binding IclR family transcriptional regulator